MARVPGQAQSHVEMLAGSLQVHINPFAVLYVFAGWVGTVLEVVVVVEGCWYPVGLVGLVYRAGTVMLTAAQFMLNSCSRLYQVHAKR